MKFYQKIAPVILCIMYTATIFGSETTTLPGVPEETATTLRALYPISEDVWGRIKAFKGKKEVIYEAVDHVKPYPSSLRQLISSPLISQSYGDPEARSLKEKFGITFLFTTVISFSAARDIKQELLDFLKKFSETKEVRKTMSESDWFLFSIKVGIPAFFLPFLRFYLFERVIVKLSKSYTYISFPRVIRIIHDNYGDPSWVRVQDNAPSLNNYYGKKYRTETRALPDFFGKGSLGEDSPARELSKKMDGDPVTVIGKKLVREIARKGNRIYRLEDGKVSIYSRKTSETPEIWLGSLSTERVMAFDVSLDGKIIVTAGKDGIRKWELQQTWEQVGRYLKEKG